MWIGSRAAKAVPTIQESGDCGSNTGSDQQCDAARLGAAVRGVSRISPTIVTTTPGSDVKALLAETLLSQVIGDEDLEQVSETTSRLRTLASIKYDDYGGYSPGVRFMESLSYWLSGFAVSDRAVALDFVLTRLTYVSAAELDHLVSTTYSDVLRPRMVKAAAQSAGLSPWAVTRVVATPEFASLQRRTLILGMSDGARLDKLRRSSPLSNEQFHQVVVLDDKKAADMKTKLAKALAKAELPGDSTFESVVVVDDFSGSGTTMLRMEADGWDGKLPKLREHLDDLKKRGVVADNARALILLYLLTAKAEEQLRDRMKEAGFEEPDFELVSSHTFRPDFPLSPETDGEFWRVCSDYFAPKWKNEYTAKGGDDLAHGFSESALPLVLHHNAPNNAPPIIWKDESEGEAPRSRVWVGVFPRHERHHPGRR